MLDNAGTALGNGLSLVVEFVPRLLLFLLILLIGYLVAKALRKLVDKILERVGFDRAVERGGIGRALAQSKYDASDLVATLVYYFIILITLQIAFGVFGPNPISELLTEIVAFLPALVVAIIIVVIAAAIAAAVKDLILGAMGGLSYGRILANIASIFIIGLGVIAALSQIGIAVAVTLPVLVTVLATVAGILIVGVGGGLIAPMRQRWERILSQAEQEVPRAARQVDPAAGRERLREDVSASAPTERIPAAGSDRLPPAGSSTQTTSSTPTTSTPTTSTPTTSTPTTSEDGRH